LAGRRLATTLNEIEAGVAIDLKAYAEQLEGELEARVNLERRIHSEGYFSSAMRMLGVAVPDLRSVAKSALTETKAYPPDVMLDLAYALIARGSHEGRQVAYEILARRKDVAPLLTEKELERLGEGNDNWASVDAFATLLAGRAWLDGRVSDARVDRWARSENLWWRRTALAATVCLNLKSRGGSGDPERTLRVCEILATDREPMVAKALSWALRSAVPHAPDRVAAFLDRHGERVPALARREVRNKLRSGLKSGKARGS
jgi:3-methyladenine DNA glycosylase AlkD